MKARARFKSSTNRSTEDRRPNPGMFADFRKSILRIPKGKVSTYGAIAYVSGYPGASRQVVWALRSSAGLPWHRVIGAGGVIKLPGEQGFEQRMRLRQEGVQLSGLRVDMKKYEHNFFGKKKSKSSSAQKSQKPRRESATTSTQKLAGKKPAVKKSTATKPLRRRVRVRGE
jgi:methylated-DNA-protein-cysteine methyltransferase-like protein